MKWVGISQSLNSYFLKIWRLQEELFLCVWSLESWCGGPDFSLREPVCLLAAWRVLGPLKDLGLPVPEPLWDFAGLPGVLLVITLQCL